MATATYTITFTSTDGETPISASKYRSLVALRALLYSCLGGHSRGTNTLACRIGAVAASATVTCANVSVNDTVTVNGVVFTAKAAEDTGAREFSQAGTDTADGASLAACINAHTTLNKLVTASANSGVVTITANVPGVSGNAITLESSNGTRLACTGSGRLASGAETLITHTF